MHEIDDDDEQEALREQVELIETVRGRHFTEWIPDLKNYRAMGENDRLQLLLEIIDATAASQRLTGAAMPSHYTLEAAYIHIERGQNERAVELLRAFISHQDEHRKHVPTGGDTGHARVQALLGKITD